MTEFAFKRTGDDNYPRYLKILIQGPKGTGKTSFIASAPNAVIAAAEAGLMSIAHLDIPYVEINDTDKLKTFRILLADEGMRKKAAKQLGLPRIDTVAIDTLDAWQDILKKEILQEKGRSEMQISDWGLLKERMGAVLKAYVALPMNVIFTVHISTSQDDEGRIILTPNLQGGIKDDVANFVDFSLLAFRQRETDKTGLPKVNYYLKCEGDQKNPTLGNRAAGRLPEICKPEFKVLHDAVFKGFTRSEVEAVPTMVTIDPPSPAAAPVAGVNAAEIQPPDPDAVPVPLSQQTPGVPVSDNDKPINAPGLAMLTKAYQAQGFVLPGDLEEWTLGKARSTAKYFMAWTADKAAGRDPSRTDLVDYLKAMGSWGGSMDGVQVGVSDIPVPPKPPKEPAPVPAPDPVPVPAVEVPVVPEVEGLSDPVGAAGGASVSASELSEEDAVELVTEQLGGVVIGRQVDPDATCEVCGEVVDDVDVAQLALTRFRKVLCIKHYKSAGADAGAAAPLSYV